MSASAHRLRREQLQARLGYSFNDSALLELALTHRSAGRHNNERLEFLGDSLVNHVIAHALYLRHPEAPEGQLSRLRARLVRGSHLAVIAAELDVGSCLILGTGERKSGGRHRESILADALEALAGAILLDAGFERAAQTLLQWFTASLDEAKPGEERDAKTRLQEWLQARGHSLPVYELLMVSGADHEQVFQVSCQVAPLAEAVVGEGSSRRRAEQSAARKVLEELERG